MPTQIKLKFHTIYSEEGRRVTVAEALNTMGEVVASYSLQMMHQWLKSQGYSWVRGSQGLWRKD